MLGKDGNPANQLPASRNASNSLPMRYGRLSVAELMKLMDQYTHEIVRARTEAKSATFSGLGTSLFFGAFLFFTILAIPVMPLAVLLGLTTAYLGVKSLTALNHGADLRRYANDLNVELDEIRATLAAYEKNGNQSPAITQDHTRSIASGRTDDDNVSRTSSDRARINEYDDSASYDSEMDEEIYGPGDPHWTMHRNHVPGRTVNYIRPVLDLFREVGRVREDVDGLRRKIGTNQGTQADVTPVLPSREPIRNEGAIHHHDNRDYSTHDNRRYYTHDNRRYYKRTENPAPPISGTVTNETVRETHHHHYHPAPSERVIEVIPTGLQEQLDQLKSQIRDLTAQLAQPRGEDATEALTAQLKQANAASRALVDGLADLTSRLSPLSIPLGNTVNTETERLIPQRSAERVARPVSEVGADSLAGLSAAMQDLVQRMNAMEGLLNQRVRANPADTPDVMRGLLEQVDAFRQRASALEAANATFGTQVAALEAAQQQNARAREEESRALQAQRAAEIAGLAGLEAQLEDTESDLLARMDAIEELLKAMQDLTAEKDAAHDAQMAAQVAALEASRTQIARLMDEATARAGRLDHIDEQLRVLGDVARNYAELLRQVALLRATQEQQGTQLTQRLDEALAAHTRELNGVFETATEALRQQVADLSRKLGGIETTSEEQAEELRALEARVAALEGQLADLEVTEIHTHNTHHHWHIDGLPRSEKSQPTYPHYASMSTRASNLQESDLSDGMVIALRGMVETAHQHHVSVSSEMADLLAQGLRATQRSPSYAGLNPEGVASLASLLAQMQSSTRKGQHGNPLPLGWHADGHVASTSASGERTQVAQPQQPVAFAIHPISPQRSLRQNVGGIVVNATTAQVVTQGEVGVVKPAIVNRDIPGVNLGDVNLGDVAMATIISNIPKPISVQHGVVGSAPSKGNGNDIGTGNLDNIAPPASAASADVVPTPQGSEEGEKKFSPHNLLSGIHNVGGKSRRSSEKRKRSEEDTPTSEPWGQDRLKKIGLPKLRSSRVDNEQPINMDAGLEKTPERKRDPFTVNSNNIPTTPLRKVEIRKPFEFSVNAEVPSEWMGKRKQEKQLLFGKQEQKPNYGVTGISPALGDTDNGDVFLESKEPSFTAYEQLKPTIANIKRVLEVSDLEKHPRFKETLPQLATQLALEFSVVRGKNAPINRGVFADLSELAQKSEVVRGALKNHLAFIEMELEKEHRRSPIKSRNPSTDDLKGNPKPAADPTQLSRGDVDRSNYRDRLQKLRDQISEIELSQGKEKLNSLVGVLQAYYMTSAEANEGRPIPQINYNLLMNNLDAVRALGKTYEDLGKLEKEESPSAEKVRTSYEATLTQLEQLVPTILEREKLGRNSQAVVAQREPSVSTASSSNTTSSTTSRKTSIDGEPDFTSREVEEKQLPSTLQGYLHPRVESLRGKLNTEKYFRLSEAEGEFNGLNSMEWDLSGSNADIMGDKTPISSAISTSTGQAAAEMQRRDSAAIISIGASRVSLSPGKYPTAVEIGDEYNPDEVTAAIELDLSVEETGPSGQLRHMIPALSRAVSNSSLTKEVKEAKIRSLTKEITERLDLMSEKEEILHPDMLTELLSLIKTNKIVAGVFVEEYGGFDELEDLIQEAAVGNLSGTPNPTLNFSNQSPPSIHRPDPIHLAGDEVPNLLSVDEVISEAVRDRALQGFERFMKSPYVTSMKEGEDDRKTPKLQDLTEKELTEKIENIEGEINLCETVAEYKFRNISSAQKITTFTRSVKIGDDKMRRIMKLQEKITGKPILIRRVYSDNAPSYVSIAENLYPIKDEIDRYILLQLLQPLREYCLPKTGHTPQSDGKLYQNFCDAVAEAKVNGFEVYAPLVGISPFDDKKDSSEQFEQMISKLENLTEVVKYSESIGVYLQSRSLNNISPKEMSNKIQIMVDKLKAVTNIEVKEPISEELTLDFIAHRITSNPIQLAGLSRYIEKGDEILSVSKTESDQYSKLKDSLEELKKLRTQCMAIVGNDLPTIFDQTHQAWCVIKEQNKGHIYPRPDTYKYIELLAASFKNWCVNNQLSYDDTKDVGTNANNLRKSEGASLGTMLGLVCAIADDFELRQYRHLRPEIENKESQSSSASVPTAMVEKKGLTEPAGLSLVTTSESQKEKSDARASEGSKLPKIRENDVSWQKRVGDEDKGVHKGP